MVGPVCGGLLRIRHDRHDLEFVSGRVVGDAGGAWVMRVQASGSADEYADHLLRGMPMELTLISRGGDMFCGEACVASVSPSDGGPTLVVLSGVGPLQPQ